MATQSTQSTNTKAEKASEAAATKPKKRGKKLELRAPFVKYEEGMIISGEIVLFTIQENKDFGNRDVCHIKLDADLSWPPSSKAKSKDRLHAKPGDVVALEVKPGLAGLKNLAEGQGVSIEVLGKVDTGKPEPAWSFEVTYD